MPVTEQDPVPEQHRARIALVVPYFGTWPVWFPAFLQSCKYNPSIHWLLFTDCEIPAASYPNVRFIPSTLQTLNTLASRKVGFDLTIEHPFKLCDLKPAYGLIFEDYLDAYDFWGHCDMDIVWGNIRAFITDDILEGYDIISTRKGKMSGHFTLYRNTAALKTLFTRDPEYRDIFCSLRHHAFDERRMTTLVEREVNRNRLRVYWPAFLFNFAHPPEAAPSFLPWLTNGWYWENGALYSVQENHAAIMYLHFLTWKATMTHCAFDYADDPAAFYISYSHIGLDTSPPPLASWSKAFLNRYRLTNWRFRGIDRRLKRLHVGLYSSVNRLSRMLRST